MADARERRGPDHETVDTPPRVPIYAMVVTLVVLAAGVVVTSILIATVWQPVPDPPSPFAGDPPRVTDAPALQAHPELDMEILSARMDEQLESVGWVDRQAGIVHMPIERALTLVAKQGLPSLDTRTRESQAGAEDQSS